MKLMNKLQLVIFLSFFYISGCGVYSFTGSTLGSDVKTMSIQTFYNNAPLGPSTMSVNFTEQIKDYFQQNTSLVLVDGEGDLQLEGFIENYTLTPVAANAASTSGGVDLANQMRITITVSAVYVNIKDETFNFDKKFSFFKDYDQTIDLASVEEEFVDEIFEQIIIDIFNSSVANW